MRILLTGGSACGKSTFAEQLAVHYPGPRYYLATMKPHDQESLDKIDKHRKQRADKGFTTIEQYHGLADVRLASRGLVLLECMCNWLANEMFTDQGEILDPFAALHAGIKNLEEQAEVLIVVTNEVGGDCLNFDEGTKAYVENLGGINRFLTERFEHVSELVCGIPLVIKGDAPGGLL